MQRRLFAWLDKTLSNPYRKAPVLGRADYANHTGIRLHHFGDEETIEYKEPLHCQPLPQEFADFRIVKYDVPFVLEVAEGELHGRHALATTSSGEIILESLLNHRPYLETISAGGIHYPKSLSQLWAQISQKPRYDKVFVLANLFGNAYFHWMLECLPRLWLYRQLGQTMPVLIEANPPTHVLETLAMLDIHDIIEWKATAASAEKLFIPMALHGTGIPSPMACRWLAGELLAKAELPKIDVPLVYISRSKSRKRRVINEDEVLKLLEQKGFQAFLLEEMSLAEQMALFRQAKCVVGAHGAGFSNAIFSQNVGLLEFFEPNYLNACYYRLASGMGFPYGLLLGESHGADIRVNLATLETMLQKFMD